MDRNSVATSSMSHNQLFLLHLPTTSLLPALVSWYVGQNLLGPLVASRRLLYATIALMFGVGLSASLSLIFWSEQDRTPIRPLIALGFYAAGYLLTAAALLLCRDAIRVVVWFSTRPWQATGRTGADRIDRRHRWWLFGSSWSLLVAAGCCVWLGHRGASVAPSVLRLNVPVRNLAGSFAGYRIAQMTDIHIHGRHDRERVRELVAQVNALDVDLIAITGDVVDGPLEELRAELTALGALRARDGVYLAVGNHEYYADVDACVREFERLGIHVLLNEYRIIDRGLDRIVVAGVTNPRRGMHGASYAVFQGAVARLPSDPRAAIRGAPLGVPRILLAHQPKSVKEARGLGFDLALAGHTHGGQFFPWNLAEPLVFPYVTGLQHDGSMTVFVGRGVGTFGPELRLGSAPQLAVLELSPDRSAPSSDVAIANQSR
jgi:uncharacterized protein